MTTCMHSNRHNHSHKCPSCGHVWQHSEESFDCFECHACPRCGTIEDRVNEFKNADEERMFREFDPLIRPNDPRQYVFIFDD